MITSRRILVTESTNPYHNLALEELLLTTLPEGQAILYLWQNAHTVVIGAGQNAWQECHDELLRAEGGTLSRRSSGGGAVYHDLGNLNFSFIVPRADYDVARQAGVVRAAVASLGLVAEQSGRNDLTIDGRKFSGNAFRLLKTAALHHGTVLVNSDMEMVKRYLNVSPDKLKSKGVKSVPARVVNLSALVNVAVPQVIERMIDAFRAEYGPAEVESVHDDQFPQLPAIIGRYAGWDWVYGASPQGDATYSTRFPWGGVQLIADVAGGVARAVRVYTDAMDETLADRLEAALAGTPWRGDALSARAAAIGEADVAAWLADA